MEIIMKTFCGDDGNYAEIPLPDILDRMTDDWIDSEVTGANISELRDACRKLLENYTQQRLCEISKWVHDCVSFGGTVEQVEDYLRKNFA